MSARQILLFGVSLLGFSESCFAQSAVWTQINRRPPAREGAGMAYDGLRARTVVFGGHSPGTSLAPFGDTWEWDGREWAFRTHSGPAARQFAAMAYDEQRGVCVLFGGQNGATLFGDTWIWDGSSWRLASIDGPVPRYGAAMTFDAARGCCVLFGGATAYQSPFGDTWEWDGASWSFVSSSGPSPRHGSAFAYDKFRARSVLFGGFTASTGDSGETWEWDGFAWLRRMPTTIPFRRSYAAATYHEVHEAVMMVGGSSGGGTTWEWTGENWFKYDQCELPPRNRHGAAWDSARGQAVLFGGNERSNGEQTWLLDGICWSIRTNPGPLTSRESQLAYDENRDVVVSAVADLTDPLETWELSGDEWTSRGRNGPAQYAFTLASDPTGRTLLMGDGGYDPADAPLWVFRSSEGTWKEFNRPGPNRRSGVRMVLDRARGRVVLFGGGRCCTGDCFYLGWCNKGDTWEWSGQQWDIVHVPHPPPGRMRHAMTYDEIRSQVVLFGGGIPSSDFDGSGLFLDGDQQTWVYDGDSWTPVADAGPSPRWRHAMAYDANRGVTVLFGGEDTADDERRFHGDTWEWDGEHWGLVTSDGPSPRSGHAMTYDRRRRGVLLLGGDDGVAYPSTQLWIYRVDPSLPDCNQNHVDDREDLFAGRSADSNGNGIPDECE